MAEHEAEGGGAGRPYEPFKGRPLSLNSKKMTAMLLRQLVRGLEVPATGSSDEIRQLIEGKLGGMGHEPRNVQVLVQESRHGT